MNKHCEFCQLVDGWHRSNCPYNIVKMKFIKNIKSIPNDVLGVIERSIRKEKPKMNIQEFTKEELENELKRREEEERIRDIPKRIGSWDIDGVIDYVENLLDEISKGTLNDSLDQDWNNSRLEVYKRFMLAVYGEGIRKWLDKKGYYL